MRVVFKGSDVSSRIFELAGLAAVRIFKVHCYALPSSTLTAWGLMAPVRAGLA